MFPTAGSLSNEYPKETGCRFDHGWNSWGGPLLVNLIVRFEITRLSILATKKAFTRTDDRLTRQYLLQKKECINAKWLSKPCKDGWDDWATPE